VPEQKPHTFFVVVAQIGSWLRNADLNMSCDTTSTFLVVHRHATMKVYSSHAAEAPISV
jgi:hypothetical protein